MDNMFKFTHMVFVKVAPGFTTFTNNAKVNVFVGYVMFASFAPNLFEVVTCSVLFCACLSWSLALYFVVPNCNKIGNKRERRD